MLNYFLIGLLFLFISLSSLAHPVSFEGSKGIMGYHSPQISHVQFNYSFKYWFALGVHHFDIPSNQGEIFANFATANFLLKRWNTSSLQANIYVVLGLGHSKLSPVSRGALLSKLQFDIEDRDYYFLASWSQINTLNSREFSDGLLRFGLSPYVGNYEDIHSWIILEGRQMDRGRFGVMNDLTPFLRLFYKNLFFEIGQSFNGFTRLNYIIHF